MEAKEGNLAKKLPGVWTEVINQKYDSFSLVAIASKIRAISQDLHNGVCDPSTD